MKKSINILILLVLISCQVQEKLETTPGTIKFSMQSVVRNEGGRITETPTPASVLISIEDESGNTVEDNKKLTLYSLGQGFVSESLQLIPGSYKLTQFMILDEDDGVMYATPQEGSELAEFVNDPLPIEFTISEDENTLVTPQVLAVHPEDTPESFGFASFGFEVVEVPQEISIKFLKGTNPGFVTNGFDSVVVTLSNGSTQIERKLNMISPVEAAGTISSEELISGSDCEECWNLKVSAYYESIDEVEEILHINELTTTANLEFTLMPVEILISDEIRILDETEVKIPAEWETWAHLTDEEGYYHLKLSTDFCNPYFEYSILRGGISYNYYEKGWFCEIGNEFKFNENLSIPVGYYGDNLTFQNLCYPDDIEILNCTIEFYFYYETQDGARHCYLVWMEEDVPIDPYYNGRMTSSKILTPKLIVK